MLKFITLLVSATILGCTYGLIALSYSLIYKSSGMMAFVNPDLMTWGVFLGYTFYNLMGLPYIVSVLLTGLIMFIIGFFIQKGVVRSLIKRDVTPMYITLTMFAMGYVFQNSAQTIWGSTPQKFNSIFPGLKVKIAGIQVQPEALICVGVSLLIMVVLQIFMNKSKLGTAMRAVSMDSMAAESVGVDVSLINGVSWGLSSMIIAAAGILCGPIYSVSINLGANMGAKAFAGAVVGGYGNMIGAIIGGLLMGFIEIFVSGYISSDFKSLIAYIILILFLFVKPTGITNERAIQDV